MEKTDIRTSKVSEFVEKYEPFETEKGGVIEVYERDLHSDLESLFRDLFDEIEKTMKEPHEIYGAVSIGTVKRVFERFTGSDYTQERK